MKSENQETVNDTPKPKKRKLGSLIVGFVLITAVVGAGTWWYIKHSEFVTTDDAYVDAYKVTVSSQIPGRVVKLYIHEGDHIKKGELLVKLDSTDYVARIRQAEVSLKEANLSIELARVKMEQAKINYDRAKEQYEANVIPKAKYQNMEKAYEEAKVGMMLANAKIPVIHSTLSTLRTSLSHTNIYAPMDGVAAKRWIMPGDVVTPGQGIFTVFGTKDSWVTSMFPENELYKIHLGDTADIQVDAFPFATFKGVFYQFGNSTASQFSLIPPDNASGNFTKVTQRVPLKLTIFKTGGQPEGEVVLLPGMSVEVKVKIKGKGK
ncbi:MAG TPA: HlyD family secretion protein [Bacteroidales bacterium]|nr:HlyD family secretion protein [Bacteroidales bacterium]